MPETMKLVKSRIAEDVAMNLSALAERTGSTVSQVIAEFIHQGLAVQREEPQIIEPDAFTAGKTNTVHFRLPDNLIRALDERASAQGLSRQRYIASLLVSHVSSEPVYSRDELGKLERVSDAVHALVITLNMVQRSIEARGTIPETLGEQVLKARTVGEILLQQIDRMRLSSLDRWRL